MQVYRWLLAPLRSRQFFTLAELNAALRERLTELNDKQSDYISIPKAGPFKPDHYRY